MSLPKPPFRVSLPAPPMRTLTRESPVRLSLPEPPEIFSISFTESSALPAINAVTLIVPFRVSATDEVLSE